MTMHGEAIARRDMAIQAAQSAFDTYIAESGYCPGDSVAPLNSARDRRDMAIDAAWLAFNQKSRPYIYGSGRHG